jgi:hypothetical protein
MLESIDIESYRNLDGLHGEGFAPFNLVIGANNSGKTSFLEAVFLHCAPLNFHALLTLLSHREGGFRANNQNLIDRFRWFFTDPLNKTTLQLRISGSYAGQSRTTALSLDLSGIAKEADKSPPTSKSSAMEAVVNIAGALAKGPPGDEPGISLGTATMTFVKSGSESRQSVEFAINKPVNIPPPKIPTDIPAVITTTGSSSHPDLGKYSMAVKSGHHKACVEMIRLVEPSIKEITLLTAEDGAPELYVLKLESGYSPLGNEGRGIIQMYQVATSLVQCRNGIMLIDELENAIHKSAMVEYVEWIARVALEYNIQVFATTHSLECIDVTVQSALAEEGRLALFKLDRKGELQLRKYNSEELRYSRIDLGMDLRID